ncbi:hypothetical protein KJ855_01280 [Patescibacteria group bacterium]|nr:hypothetical protein [Patescibacteria group bacterium]
MAEGEKSTSKAPSAPVGSGIERIPIQKTDLIEAGGGASSSAGLEKIPEQVEISPEVLERGPEAVQEAPSLSQVSPGTTKKDGEEEDDGTREKLEEALKKAEVPREQTIRTAPSVQERYNSTKALFKMVSAKEISFYKTVMYLFEIIKGNIPEQVSDSVKIETK